MAVLIGLANHAHANGRGAYPSQERLAHYARKSVRSVQRDLTELARLGIIRRGDQRHVAYVPVDRRPVVWDLALERRRELPTSLDPFAEPQSGRSTDVPEAVDNRGDVDVIPVADRGDVDDRPGRRTRPSGVTRTSHKPSLNHQKPIARARSLRGGAALPTDPRAAQCSRHRGSPADNCGPCRSEALGGAA
ncbi:helix-turn-helix domain-containing protein [Micromonospora kangleipakensis]|uniref:helix-turn-helix domain-containing protein n=1 Tax=Micromonospora kangleipakensis TaxID=1077942 RepID=UPI003BF78890